MKKLTVSVIILTFAILMVAPRALAGNCYSDKIVSRWIMQRDVAAESVIQWWAKGSPAGDFISDVAVILSNELYIFSQCREQPDFLDEHVYVLNGSNQSSVETVPAIILEHLVGKELLSPWTQFPSARKGGAVQ